MRRSRWSWAVVSLSGLLYWWMVGMATGQAEPWDAQGYPLALALAAMLVATCGYLLPDRPARWGVVIVFCQFPVMLAHAPPGPLLPVGLLLLALESLPAMLVAVAAARLRRTP